MPQQELPIKFIRTDTDGESVEWIFDLLDKYE